MSTNEPRPRAGTKITEHVALPGPEYWDYRCRECGRAVDLHAYVGISGAFLKAVEPLAIFVLDRAAKAVQRLDRWLKRKRQQVDRG